MKTEEMTNVTFDEITVGATATLSRTVSQTSLEILAILSGDVDPFVLQGNGLDEVRPDATCSEAAGAEALIAAVLGTKLPGPGMRIVRQELSFGGTVHTGDEIIATVTVKEKFPADHRVVFDCSCVRNDGEVLVSGTVSVIAPTQRVIYDEVAPPELALRRGDGLMHLLRASQSLPPVRCAVVHPCDQGSLQGPLEAARRNIIDPVFVGPREKMQAVADSLNVDLRDFEVVTVPHSHAAAARAVELARAGEVEAVMKGSLHTDELLSAIVPADTGLRTARRMSHVYVMDVPSYPKMLLITDAAINIYPQLTEKIDIVQNAIDLCHILRNPRPCVAILSAVETVNPSIESTLAAAALCKMADRGQITGGLLDGPLAFDNAISVEAARTKGIDSEVAGHADVLIVPDLESGNMLAKQLSYLAGAEAAGIVMGTRVPVALTSRADSVRTRLASLALLSLVADARRTGRVELK